MTCWTYGEGNGRSAKDRPMAFRFWPMVIVAMMWLHACAGPQGAGSTQSPAGSSQGGKPSSRVVGLTNQTQGMPEWISKGTGPQRSDGQRLFYGVGAASGIKNPSLLRQTADNRAKAELAKVFQTFSAQLMHDYMSSDNQQAVEQATKTFSAMSLEGVEIVDRYQAADGMIYALASLDAQRMGPLLAQAKQQGLIKATGEPPSIDDMFDKGLPGDHGKKSNGAGHTSEQRQASAKSTENQGKSNTSDQEPQWVQGEDPEFSAERYLCAVGSAAERKSAEDGAYGALTRVFTSRVQTSSKDFLAAYQQTGAPDLEVQSNENLVKISTDTTLQGVRTMATWSDNKGSIYALACLERAVVAPMLIEQIHQADRAIGTLLAQVQQQDKASQLKDLSRAMNQLVTREASNNQLRLINRTGLGIPSPYAAVDVASALEAAVQALRVGVVAQGPYDEDFRQALMAGLTEKGYQIAEMGPDVDVVIQAKIRVEDAGAGPVASMVFARGVIAVEVKNIARQAVVATFQKSQKEGSRNKEEAERAVVRKLAKGMLTELAGKIDTAMRGG